MSPNHAFQLRAFIAYKARAAGVRLVLVDPAYTSQTCSRCGHCERANRKSQAKFLCVSCGFSAHADVNAAVNIAVRTGAMKGEFYGCA
jgi:transposase